MPTVSCEIADARGPIESSVDSGNIRLRRRKPEGVGVNRDRDSDLIGNKK